VAAAVVAAVQAADVDAGVRAGPAGNS